DLILKCWTEPGPFRWEGRHYHFRHVNPWCLPLQKPHPPIWIPGTASPETAIWAGRRGYTYVPFLVPFEIARELFEFYRQGAAEVADRFAHVQRELGIGHLLLEAQESRMDHPTTMRSIELMGAKVIPALATL